MTDSTSTSLADRSAPMAESGAMTERLRANAADLVLQGLTKHFRDVVAVDDVNLAIDAGDFLTLLGPSGSGKTTVLRMVAGFETPTAGRILVGGEDIVRLPPDRRNVGMVFQSYSLFPHMTVAANLAYPLRRRKMKSHAIDVRVDRMLEMLRLPGLGHRRPNELSGGQRQRVALGRAMIFEPPLLLMDEPLGALDAQLRYDLQDEIRRLHREVGATIIAVTHDREEALTMSTKVGVLRSGHLYQVAGPEEIFQRPVNEFVARFLGEVNLWPVATSGSPQAGRALVDIAGQRVDVPAAPGLEAGDARLMVRPWHLSLEVPATGPRFRGTVRDIAFFGEAVRITLDSPQVGCVLLNALAQRATSLRVGDDVEFGFLPDDALVVPPSDENA